MQSARKKRVLVVDDEPTIRQLLADALREADFEVRSAADGAEGLEIMRGWLPHVIVLDLMMPRMGGNVFTEQLRGVPRLAHLPILLVTAAYGAEAAAKQLGAQALLTKPFELDRLVELVTGLTDQPAAVPARS